MMPESNPPDWVDAQRLHELLGAVHDQVATALWLSVGMVLAIGAISSIAFGWRRAALAAGFLYSLTLCFVHNGHAQLLGPLGCAVAVTGFLWPRRSRP
jgi:4-amino-4-deoxy-L-arabinose transferase-like glycosyltransferase